MKKLKELFNIKNIVGLTWKEFLVAYISALLYTFLVGFLLSMFWNIGIAETYSLPEVSWFTASILLVIIDAVKGFSLSNIVVEVKKENEEIGE